MSSRNRSRLGRQFQLWSKGRIIFAALALIIAEALVTYAQAPTADNTATSINDPAVTDSVTDHLGTIKAKAVDLTHHTSVNGGAWVGEGLGAGPEGTAVRTNIANAGATTTFNLFINNVSPAADNYDLAANTTHTFAALTLPAGWRVRFYRDDGDSSRNAGDTLITNTGDIAVGSEALVFADVTVPAGFTATTLNIFFRSLSPATGVSDIIHNAVTVATQRVITLAPDNSGQTFARGVVVYQYTMNNRGNVEEAANTITLDVTHHIAGFTTVVYYDADDNGVINIGTDPVVVTHGAPGLIPVALPAGGSLPLLASVSAPADATIGTVDVTTLTATVAGDINGVAPPPMVSATDTTTIISGDVSLSKSQSPDIACDGTADVAFGSANISAAPGQCICYQVTATNTARANAKTMVINDTIPAFTTQNTLATITGGGTLNTIITEPGIGHTGAIEANVGMLTPRQTAVLSFCVRINQ